MIVTTVTIVIMVMIETVVMIVTVIGITGGMIVALPLKVYAR